MNIWHDMEANQIRKEEYMIFTANSMDSSIMLSFDGHTGLLVLRHINDKNIHRPYNTGFIPRTCTQDGLPMETILLCSHPIPQMTLVRCRPVGLAVLHLENGGTRRYLLSSVCEDEFWSACLTVDEIPSSTRKAMIRYLRYEQQMLEQPTSSIEVVGLDEAEQFFTACMQNYLMRYGGKREQTAAVSQTT